MSNHPNRGKPYHHVTSDNRIHVSVYKEGSKWWISIADIDAAAYLSLRDFKTKVSALQEVDKIIPVLGKILTKKERRAKQNIYLHGAEETHNGIKVIYAPLYTTPMGKGFGAIYPATK